VSVSIASEVVGRRSDGSMFWKGIDEEIRMW